MPPRRIITAALRLLVSLLIGVAPGFVMGVILGASHYPWRFNSQQLFFFDFLLTGAVVAALCPFAIGVGGFRKCLKWSAVGLIAGGVESALAGAVGWWVKPPTVFAAAFLWWGVVVGAWCGWLHGKTLPGALLGLLLTGLLAGLGVFVTHPDPLGLFGGLLGLFAGTVVYRWPNSFFMWSARSAIGALVLASFVVICALRGTYWPSTTFFRVTDGPGGQYAYFQPQFGDEVLTSVGDAICVWDVRDGWVRRTIPRRHESCALTWQSKDDPVCVIVSSSGRVQKWHVSQRELLAETIISEFVAKPPREQQLSEYINPYKVVLSRDGRLAVILVKNENRIALVDFQSRNIDVATLGDLPLSTLAISSDGRKLLLGASNQPAMFLYDCTARTPRLLRTYANVFPPRGEMLFSPDNRRACIFGGRLDERMLRIVDLERKDAVLDIPGLTHRIENVAFSRDGQLLLSAEWGNIVRLWDTTSGKELRCFRQHQSWILRALFDRTFGTINTVAISPNGAWGLANSGNGTVSLWGLQAHETRP